jgi:hypothetical protein
MADVAYKILIKIEFRTIQNPTIKTVSKNHQSVTGVIMDLK